jgi:DNA polymerase
MPEIPKKSDLSRPDSRPNIIKNQASPPLGAAEAIVEAQKSAKICKNLEELQQAIADFDGLSVKKTATNMVFSDGDPQSDIMVIGEAPGADEDIQGKPFVGISGQLLDKILACIHLSRKPEAGQKSVYISNILNWRPPGNRTPTDSEISISLPFIEKHIELVKPKVVVLCGGVAGKSLLQRNDSISKLRGTFHDYQTTDGHQLKMIATYHPAYLLRTPAQKKAVWADMLMLQDYLEN